MPGSLTDSLADDVGRSVAVLGAWAAAALRSTYWVLERRRQAWRGLSSQPHAVSSPQEE